MNRKKHFEPPLNDKRKERKGPLKGTHILLGLAGVLLAFNLLLLYGIFASPQGILGYRQQCQQVTDMEARVKKLKEENRDLFRKIQAFKSDPQAQERLVREQLGWARENEIVIEFPATRKPAEDGPAEKSEPLPSGERKGKRP